MGRIGKNIIAFDRRSTWRVLVESCLANFVRIAITTVAVLVVLVHLIWPSLKVDSITVALLVIAVVPWLGSVFKSIELPGGGKIEYQQLEKAGESASRVGLLSVGASLKEVPSFIAIAEEDPNLALAGLRIEIEKRVRAIAVRHGIDDKRMGIGQLLRALSSAGALSNEQRSVLSDLMGTLNMAVHGAEVSRQSAEWAI